MKNLFLPLLTLVLTMQIYGCKKSSEIPLQTARVLSLNNKQPIAGAEIRIYQNTIAEGTIDTIVYTDADGYFIFQAYDNVTALASKSGWWNPMAQGYIMRQNGAALSSVLYLVLQSNFATVIVHCDSLQSKFRIWSIVSLQDEMFSGKYLSAEIIDTPPSCDTYSYQVPLMDSLQNEIQFARWTWWLFGDPFFFTIADTSFVPDGSAQQVFEFHY